jgi:hypothetical protein
MTLQEKPEVFGEETCPLFVRHSAVRSSLAVTCDVHLERTTYTYQQRDVWDNNPVCVRVPRGHFRLSLYAAFRDVSDGVVGVERDVCILQDLPATFKHFPL